MTNKLKLTIGEFSKLCYVTVKTLRHYEKRGLITPYEVDEWTGYRYYVSEQLERLIAIKKMKQMGLSLDEIREMFDHGLQQPDKSLVQIKIAETEQEIGRLRERLVCLQSLQKHTSKNSKKMSKIVIKPLAGGIVASWRSHIDGYENLGKHLLSIVQPEMQRLGCRCPEETAYCFTVDYNQNYNPNDIDLEYCEVVAEKCEDSDILKFKELPLVENAVCIEHWGDYNHFDETMNEVMQFIKQSDWQIVGEPRFCYIHGIWDCDSVDDWFTEVQIPVKK